MKKPLLRTIALLSVAFAVSLTAQLPIKGAAEAASPQASVETVEQELTQSVGVGKLSVRRCEFSVVVGERAIYLPEFKATSADGTDISGEVKITDSLESEIYNNRAIILKEPGEHVITYSVVDPANGAVLERSFTITKQREIFNYYALTGERYEKAAVQDQYCISLNPGQGISRFNMPVSDLYYAEVYFNATEATQFKAGLAHVVRTNYDPNTNSNLWWASMVDEENGMTHSVYKDADWVLAEIDGTKTQTQLIKEEGFKYAVARKGTTLYAFINDELVYTYVCDELEKYLTAPGIFTAGTKFDKEDSNGNPYKEDGDFAKKGGVKISAIDYFDGDAASAKIDELVAKATPAK